MPMEKMRTAFPRVAADLRLLGSAINYQHWLYSQVKGVIGKRILEVGSGIGSFTTLLRQHGKVLATDMEESYISILQDRFKEMVNVSVMHMKLGESNADEIRRIRDFNPDTVVCMNVLEHVKNDVESAKILIECLPTGGHLAIILPAMHSLYSDLDKEYGHFRRYEEQDIIRMAKEIGGVELVRNEYFNGIGIVGWWANHVVLKRKQLPPRQVLGYDRLVVPVVMALEKWIRPVRGLSLVVWIKRIS